MNSSSGNVEITKCTSSGIAGSFNADYSADGVICGSTAGSFDVSF